MKYSGITFCHKSAQRAHAFELAYFSSAYSFVCQYRHNSMNLALLLHQLNLKFPGTLLAALRREVLY